MDFKEFRIKNKLNYKQMANLFGISSVFYKNIENGGEHPSWEKKFSQQKLDSFKRVLKYVNHQDIDKEITQDRINMLENYGLSKNKAGNLMGGANLYLFFKKQNDNCNEMEKNPRWIKQFNALMIELEEQQNKKATELSMEIIESSGILDFIDEKIKKDITPDDFYETLKSVSYNSKDIFYFVYNDKRFWCVNQMCHALDYDDSHATKIILQENIIKLKNFKYKNFANEIGILNIFSLSRKNSVKEFEKWFKSIIQELDKSSEEINEVEKKQDEKNNIDTYVEQQPEQIHPTKQLSNIDVFEQMVITIKEIDQTQKNIQIQQNNTIDELMSKIDLLNQEIESLKEKTAVDYEKSRNQEIYDKQRVSERKNYLQQLVKQIVSQIRKNTDYYSRQIAPSSQSCFQYVWTCIHNDSNPPVSKIDDYLTVAHINTAIEAAKILLIRFGGTIPEQIDISI